MDKKVRQKTLRMLSNGVYVLSLRTAAMISGGLKDTCETQVTVAAP